MEEKAETVGLFELYKFSDTTDKLVLMLGVIMAIACVSNCVSLSRYAIAGEYRVPI